MEMNAMLILLYFLSRTASLAATPLPLSSLVSPCEAMTTMIDHFGSPRLRAVLRCDGRAVRIVGPESLEGVVDIKTPAAALEYVRFFSTERTYNLFNFGEVVEIGGFGKDRLTADGRYLIAPEYKDIFQSYHEAEAEERRDIAGPAKLFKLRRVVVATDGKIYDIEESVGCNGSYAVLSRTVLMENCSRIGLWHLGEI
jgi:hypothetical protein